MAKADVPCPGESSPTAPLCLLGEEKTTQVLGTALGDATMHEQCEVPGVLGG